MKTRNLLCTVLAGLGLAAAAMAQSSDAPGIPYLDQNKPGLIPHAFAPGIVTTGRWEYGGTFSPDMSEFHLLREDAAGVMWHNVFEFREGRWHERVLSQRRGQPFISPDGTTMHLGRRYRLQSESTGDESGWSEVERLGGPFEDYLTMRLTASEYGTYFLDEVGSEDGDGRIRYSRVVDGVREAPQLASEAINTGTWLAHPFIAPDESYLLWDGRREGGFGDSDIYVSFRKEDGSWGDAINLGDKINTPAWEASASVTPDGKYLFFNRDVGDQNVDIFWVDAQVLWDLKPDQ